jgi:hypothetical protein
MAIAGAGLIIVLAGLVAGLLTKRLRPAWERVDGALSRSQNRSIRRQIRGREPVDPQHRAVAEQDVWTAVGLIPCYIGTALMAIGLMLVVDLPEITAVLAGLLVLLAATAAWQYGSTVHAARQWLASV